jgi:hypothetical protein
MYFFFFFFFLRLINVHVVTHARSQTTVLKKKKRKKDVKMIGQFDHAGFRLDLGKHLRRNGSVTVVSYF